MRRITSGWGVALAGAVIGLCAVGCVNPGNRQMALETALATSDRPAADRARDVGRRPAEVMMFLGVEPGMTVIDLFASGGYYTEVLSRTVGASGTVYAQNPPLFLEFRDGYYDKLLSERLAGDRLPNVVRIDKNINETGIPPGSVDVALTALNFHDVYNRDSTLATGVLTAVGDLLKPGGVLGVIDHVGESGLDNVSLHRVEPVVVRQAALEAGYLIEAESDLLAMSEDHTALVFDEAVRGKTDRFLFRLRKPD